MKEKRRSWYQGWKLWGAEKGFSNTAGYVVGGEFQIIYSRNMIALLGFYHKLIIAAVEIYINSIKESYH
jgi:hypothetical protein